MVSIEISIADGKCFAVVPFNRDFNAGVKRFGGRWRPPVWVVDMRDEERLRALCREVWGTDGTDKPRLLTLRVDVFAALDGGDASALWVAGRCVASRARRDYEVKLAEGVVILEGGFPNSGGSSKRPLLAAKPGTVLEVRDVPEPAALKERSTYKGISIIEPAYEEHRTDFTGFQQVPPGISTWKVVPTSNLPTGSSPDEVKEDLERTTERPGEAEIIEDPAPKSDRSPAPLERARHAARALKLSAEQHALLIGELRAALDPAMSALMRSGVQKSEVLVAVDAGISRVLSLCFALEELSS